MTMEKTSWKNSKYMYTFSKTTKIKETNKQTKKLYGPGEVTMHEVQR